MSETWMERLDRLYYDPEVRDYGSRREAEASMAVEHESIVAASQYSDMPSRRHSLFDEDDWCAYSVGGSLIDARSETVRSRVIRMIIGDPWAVCGCYSRRYGARSCTFITAYLDALEAHDFAATASMEADLVERVTGDVVRSLAEGRDIEVPVFCANILFKVHPDYQRRGVAGL